MNQKMTDENIGGPWKVVKCRGDELEETLNGLIAAGFLIHAMYPGDEGGNQTFTITAIEEMYVQPAQILTEDTKNEISEKLSNNA